MKKNLLFLVFAFSSLSLSATHIIGGSISYEYLGNDEYKLKLVVIRDCFNGVPWFDDPASIGVFDVNGDLIEQLLVPLDQSSNDTISLDVPNNICTFPPDICVNQTVYETIATLPNIAGGYTLAYQRCCRTGIISNLISPQDVGMTFHTHIDPAMQNSSPVFNSDFPVAVFTGTPFIYDGSATDPDGDSIAYELTTPFGGASDINPQPQPPSVPPYDPVLFQTPAYSVTNMLGGNYPLEIDFVTGEMGAIPIINGVFQIAYAVKEYRNGQPIGTTFREFTFVVLPPLPNQNYDVSGAVYVNGNTPLDIGSVQVLERDIFTDSLSVYDEQPIGAGATYSFLDIPPGVFYVKAIVDPASMYYSSYLPTYYNEAEFWYDANPVNQCDTSQAFRDIFLIEAPNLTGMFEIEGLVVDPNNMDEPVANLNLLLGNENGEVIQARTTDENGVFKFENLENGNYELYADLINSNIDNTNPPIIEVIENTSVQVFIYNDSLSLETPLNNIEKEVTNHFISLFPNPTNENVLLEMNVQNAATFSMNIYNAFGGLMKNILQDEIILAGRFSKNIKLNNFPTGVYFIEINNGDNKMVERIVKK